MVRFLLKRDDSFSILEWVPFLMRTNSSGDAPRSGTSRTVEMSENVKVLASKKHSTTLGLSDRTVSGISLLDLKFLPYKMMMVLELFPSDFQNRLVCCQRLLEVVSTNKT